MCLLLVRKQAHTTSIGNLDQVTSQMTKHPKGEGVYWAALDDGEQVTEVVLLHVRYFSGQASFEDGVDIVFIDGSGRHFDMKAIDQQIVQPAITIVTGCGTAFSKHDQVRITWLGEVKPPRTAPRPGTPVDPRP